MSIVVTRVVHIRHEFDIYIGRPGNWGNPFILGRDGTRDEVCETRRGQVIVCENTKATWLPFQPLIQLSGQKHTTTEAIWRNEKNDL